MECPSVIKRWMRSEVMESFPQVAERDGDGERESSETDEGLCGAVTGCCGRGGNVLLTGFREGTEKHRTGRSEQSENLEMVSAGDAW